MPDVCVQITHGDTSPGQLAAWRWLWARLLEPPPRTGDDRLEEEKHYKDQNGPKQKMLMQV